MRTGVFGGSFDPPHIGHAIVARDLVERLDLGRLIVVPAADPPHRSVELPAETRLRLVRTMFEGVSRVEVSDIEHTRAGPSYSVDTLEALVADATDDEWLFVMGDDQFSVLDTWRRPERIAELAQIVVMRRTDREPKPPTGVDDIDYIVVDVTRIDVSASRIRDRLSDGRSIRFLVPESIRPDIERAWDRDGSERTATQ